MIRYPITLAELERKVDALAPTWRARAKTRTNKFQAAGKYSEPPSAIWSEVKPIYMEIQHNKCAYCERRLASASFGGAVEHDLEHFRPKSSVVDWPDATAFTFSTGTASAAGYFWLAYHLLNYSASCKKCNSGLKLNYFPVGAIRGAAANDPISLVDLEKPFLIYPIGDIDDDPQELITFLGLNAISVKRTGPKRRRADVTIAFFRLNDSDREELFRGRAERLRELGTSLETINDPGTSEARKTIAKRDIEQMIRPSSEHVSCVRAMIDLYEADTPQARLHIEAAREYLESVG